MKQLTILAFIGALFVLLCVIPVQAEMLSVADSDLAAITGKDNTSTLGGTSSLTQGVDGSNGNVTIGYFQWSDDHTGDLSDHKGANDQSGSTSLVQANVVSALNGITWGAYAAVNTTAASIGADFDSETWATLYVGGF
jgi:hypothetical protein